MSTRALAYALTIVLGLTLDITGALHVYGLSALMGQRLAVGAALLLAIIAAGWLLVAAHRRRYAVLGGIQRSGDVYAVPDARESGAKLPDITQRILTLLILLAWLATAYDFLVFVSPGFTMQRGLVFGGGALALLLALLRPPAPGWLALGAALLGATVRVASYPHMPIEPARGDMLPLVQSALGNFLSGRSPYTIYHMPWDLPLTYLPVTWLAYLPTALLGLDLRLTNLFAELGIGGTLVWLAADGRKLPRFSRQFAQCDTNKHRWHDEPSLLLWSWVFLQPTALHWSLTTTAPVQWVLLSVTLALLVTGRDRFAALALGLCAAASPLTMVAALFILLHWLRLGGIRRAALLAGFSGLVAAIFILPFLLWSPQPFIFGVWRWFNDNDLFPRLRWEMDNTWARQTGFSGIFWRHGLVSFLKPLQALLLAGIAALYWRLGATGQRLAPLVTAAFLLFTLFNPVLWPYLYNSAQIAALLAVAALDRALLELYS